MNDLLRRAAWLILATAVPFGAACSEVATTADPETGLARWELQDGALSAQFAQLLPDQTRAFFLGRGFDTETAEAFAGACVFQAIVRNQSGPDRGPAVTIDLARWRITHAGRPQALPLGRQWQARWEAAGVSQAARIAFRWALFPTGQTLLPGDYNWGMIPFGPAPGERFDLDLTWTENGAGRAGRVAGIRCAADE